MKRVPSTEKLDELISLIRDDIFPEFSQSVADIRPVIRYKLHEILLSVIPNKAQEVAENFVGQMDELKRLLHSDVTAVIENDPAVEDRDEVILCYPLTVVMLHYRTAHALLKTGVPIIPRMLTEIAHSRTGVDIHPAAKIGDYFCFDHGTGIVVGATSIIGNHVVLYQGVTLGAKNFKYDENGHPIDLPRHPILEDNVTVYSNTSILGRVTIGHDTIIGGNVWLSHDVPPYSRIIQNTPVQG